MLKLNHLKTNCRNETSFFISQVIRQTRFTDRTQVREFTLDNLVGTCGGYIGMFLGYALIQFPQFLQFMFRTMKQISLSRRAQKIVQYDIKMIKYKLHRIEIDY